MEVLTERFINFASIAEPKTLAQSYETAQMDFIYPHLALMPDCHLGLGATVGSVIPTIGAIIPAAVGVDIGCFVGSTEVVLADSRSHRLDELVGREPFHVYSSDADGVVRMSLATAKRTRLDAALVQVTLDNGEDLRCTPDHEFMLRDGTYRRADALSGGDSLMPFYSVHDQDGYFMVRQPTTGLLDRSHWIAARSGLLGDIPEYDDDFTIIHHMNFTPDDNDPSNLIFMSSRAHSSYHRLVPGRNDHWQSASFEDARKAALAAKAATPEGHEYFAARGTKNILAYMSERPDHFAESVSGNGERGREYLVDYNTSEAGRAKSRETAAKENPCPECGVPVKSWIGMYNHRKTAHALFANHKVASVVAIQEREDVYCLTVPEFGNFALAAGVFVHNCGMRAVRTQLTRADVEAAGDLHPLHAAISAAVPLSAGNYNRRPSRSAGARITQLEGMAGIDQAELVAQRGAKNDWRLQLGSLGSGNHFIECSFDEDDRVWLFLHSGSRGVGNKLAQRHIKVAQEICYRDSVKLPNRDLAYLTDGTAEFDSYIEALQWAQTFAALNRDEMMDQVIGCVEKFFGVRVQVSESTSCHHNYTARETHYGREVWLSRKGAIAAHQGTMGLIPGSMGDKSYVVIGLGNKESLCSAPHGAGREYSRSKAKVAFTRADLDERMAGIVWGESDAFLDEHPKAYKAIDTVMNDSRDLVEVIHELRQFLNVKGN